PRRRRERSSRPPGRGAVGLRRAPRTGDLPRAQILATRALTLAYAHGAAPRRRRAGASGDAVGKTGSSARDRALRDARGGIVSWDEIAADLRRFLTTSFANEGVELTDRTSLLEEWFVDSLGILDLVLFLEQQFGLEVQRADVNGDNFSNVEALTR